MRDRCVPVVVKDRQCAGIARARYQRPTRPGRTQRPRSRRASRTTSRGGDSGDDDPEGEPDGGYAACRTGAQP